MAEQLYLICMVLYSMQRTLLSTAAEKHKRQRDKFGAEMLGGTMLFGSIRGVGLQAGRWALEQPEPNYVESGLGWA